MQLGLAPRLFIAMALVVLSGAGTLLLVALVVAPAVFYSHLHRAGVPAVAPAVQTHVDGPEALDVLATIADLAKRGYLVIREGDALHRPAQERLPKTISSGWNSRARPTSCTTASPPSNPG